MHKISSLGVTAVIALSLVACASSDPDPSASTGDSSTSQQPTSSSTGEPTEDTTTEPADAEAGSVDTSDWQQITTSDGFVAFSIPSDWTVVDDSVTDGDWIDHGFDVFDASGNQMLRYDDSNYGQSAPAGGCVPRDPASTILDEQPFEGSVAVTGGGDTTAPVVGANVQPRDEDAGLIYRLQIGLTTSNLIGPEACEPFFTIYPGDTTFVSFYVTPDPFEAFEFATLEEAQAYVETDEYATLVAAIQTLQVGA